MKKRILRTLLTFLLLFSLMAPVIAYADTACIVSGTQNYLALRNAPATDARNEIGRLHNGDTFTVTSMETNGFAYGYTRSGNYGYVNASYLKTAGSKAPQTREETKGTACLKGLVANDILSQFSRSAYSGKTWLDPKSDTDDAVADSAYVLGLWAWETIQRLPQDIRNKAVTLNNRYEWCFGTDIGNSIPNNFPYYYSYYFALKNYYGSNGKKSAYTYSLLYREASEYGNPEKRIRGLFEELQPLITDFNNILRSK